MPERAAPGRRPGFRTTTTAGSGDCRARGGASCAVPSPATGAFAPNVSGQGDQVAPPCLLRRCCCLGCGGEPVAPLGAEPVWEQGSPPHRRRPAQLLGTHEPRGYPPDARAKVVPADRHHGDRHRVALPRRYQAPRLEIPRPQDARLLRQVMVPHRPRRDPSPPPIKRQHPNDRGQTGHPKTPAARSRVVCELGIDRTRVAPTNPARSKPILSNLGGQADQGSKAPHHHRHLRQSDRLQGPQRGHSGSRWRAQGPCEAPPRSSETAPYVRGRRLCRGLCPRWWCRRRPRAEPLT